MKNENNNKKDGRIKEGTRDLMISKIQIFFFFSSSFSIVVNCGHEI